MGLKDPKTKQAHPENRRACLAKDLTLKTLRRLLFTKQPMPMHVPPPYLFEAIPCLLAGDKADNDVDVFIGVCLSSVKVIQIFITCNFIDKNIYQTIKYDRKNTSIH